MGETVVGTIRDLWRYPVKSMLGERVERIWLDQRGAVGDRLYAVRDEAGKFGSGKTTRRFQRIDGLFRFRSSYDGDMPLITFPDGLTLRGDEPEIHAALSAQLGLPVTLACEADVSHFDDGPLHLLTTDSLRALRSLGASHLAGADGQAKATLDHRRFRPNIFIESQAGGFAEETWLGRDIAVGPSVQLRVVKRADRCVMVTMAQADLTDDPRILRAVAHANDACLGVFAEPLVPGSISVGDSIRLL